VVAQLAKSEISPNPSISTISTKGETAAHQAHAYIASSSSPSRPPYLVSSPRLGRRQVIVAAQLPLRRTRAEGRLPSGSRWTASVGAALVMAVTLAAVMADPSESLADEVSVCPERFPLTRDGSTLEVPYCSNHGLFDRNIGIERAVIVLQGASRNAEGYFENVVEAADNAGVEAQTLIVAPHFLIDDDLAETSIPAGLYWSSSGWKIGDGSLSEPYDRPWDISSFSVIDELIAHLSNRELFPNLTNFVVAGHSAGGQFVNRYAAGTSIDTDGQSGNHFRFVVANPSSYLYLSDRRPRPGRIDSFRRLTESERKRCRGFNRYKYGTTELNEYMSLAGAAELSQRYASQDVIYLLGEEDTDRSDPLLDTTCAANWQGSDRLRRGIAYYNYLGYRFGARIYDRHTLSLVPGAGHDSEEMFDSIEGRASLFDVGSSDQRTMEVEARSRPRPSRALRGRSVSRTRDGARTRSTIVSTLRLVTYHNDDEGRR
jgi:hypothetical protein